MSRTFRLALLATLAAFGLAAPAFASDADSATPGSMSAPYAVGGGEVTRACPALGANVGGACLQVPATNAFDLVLSVTDGSGLRVGAYYEVDIGALSVANGFFCGAQPVHTSFANPPVVKVFPSVTNGARSCGAPATTGEVRVSW